MSPTGNTVLVTGGTRGIGLAIAREFAARHNRVLVVGRDLERLRRVEEQHAGIEGLCYDLSRMGALEELSHDLEQHVPGLNVLIHNAAVQHNYLLTEESLPWSRINEELHINLRAPIVLSAMLLPQLSRQKEAAIVTLSSVLAFAPKRNAAVYCATKAALDSFTRCLRDQLACSSVRVRTLRPPLVDTGMTAGRGSGKIAPEEVAAALLLAWERDENEINVGPARLAARVQRWWPNLLAKKLRDSE